jgi:hypothetical protein
LEALALIAWARGNRHWIRGRLTLDRISTDGITTAEWLDLLYVMLVQDSGGEVDWPKLREAVDVELSKTAVRLAVEAGDKATQARLLAQQRESWGTLPHQVARAERAERLMGVGGDDG